MLFITSIRAQATPHLSTKRKSLHGRKLRPKSVVDSVDGLSADDIPDLLPSLPKSAEGKHVTVCGYAGPRSSCVSQHHVLRDHQSASTALFWDVRLCSVVEEYEHFGVTYSTLKMEADCSPKRWYLPDVCFPEDPRLHIHL